MNIRFTPVVWSILAALLLVIVLAVALIATMLLAQGGEELEEAAEGGTEVETVDCTFTGLAGQLMVYHAPVVTASQQKVTVLGSENYPIVSRRNDMYQITYSDETGWVLGQDGTLQGDDCEDIPHNDTSLGEFPTVCTIRTEQAQPVYSEPELATEIETLDTGTYVVDAINGDRYLVLFGDGLVGWMLSRQGQLVGACDELVNPQEGAAPTACTVQTQQAQPVYSEPELVTEIQTLQPGSYVVDAINNDRYLVLFGDGLSGWILGTTGQLVGACDKLVNPPQDVVPTDCTVQIQQAQPVYSEPELLNEIQTLQAGTYVVERINNDRYLVLLGDGRSGWILSAGGQLVGDCDVLINPPQ